MDDNVVNRVIPHSTEAEQSVIGAMMVDNEVISVAADLITGSDFYNKQYGIIFDTIVELSAQHTDIDIVTLREALKAKQLPEDVCSVEYIKDFVVNVPTAVNIKSYAEIVREKSDRRRVIRAAEKVVTRGYEDNDSIMDYKAESEKALFEVFQDRGNAEFESITSVVSRALDDIYKRYKNDGELTGLNTGFTKLNSMTAGLQKSDLILIAARPSMGKTAFALNIALNVALRERKTVALFSLEMSKVQLVNRLIAMESKVDSKKIREGSISDESEWAKLVEGSAEVGTAKLFVDDTSSISAQEIRSKCRKLKLEEDLSLVVIDYLQLMSGNGKSDSRQQEISEISRSLKSLARELDIPVIALSQLNRAVDSRADHIPVLADLRESGAIEQDADVVMFIYRDDYYTKEKSERPNVADIIIAKQRNGPVGTVSLAWLPSFTQFCDLEVDKS